MEIWKKTRRVLSHVAAQCKGNIRALAVSSFGEAFVAIDKNGIELGEVMLYTDRRGEKEYADAIQKTSATEVAQICGLALSPAYTVSKVLYLKKQRPEIYGRSYKFLLIEDYIYFKLSGLCHTDHSLAARTMLFNIHKRNWSETLLKKFGIEREKFSDPVCPGKIIGTISPSIADFLGLPKNLKLVMGGHDQPVNAFGAGANKKTAVCSMGTTECLTPVLDRPLHKETIIQTGLSSEPFVDGKGYCTLAYNPSSGLLVKWFFSRFACECDGNQKQWYQLFEENAPSSPTKLMVQPYLMGSGTPYIDHRARFALLGADASTTAFDIYKALLEGLCFDQLLNFETLKKSGVKIDSVIAVGGGSQSPAWLSIKADILGMNVETPKCREAGALGCAMLCAVALGTYKDLYEAGEAMRKTDRVYEPNEKHESFYREKYALYLQLHDRLKIYSDFAAR